MIESKINPFNSRIWRNAIKTIIHWEPRLWRRSDRGGGKYCVEGEVKLPQGWTIKDMEDEERRERRRRQKQKVVSCCKKFAAFLFSHIGLGIMVVSYSILGGFIFRALEAPEELKMRTRISEWKNATVDDLCRQTVLVLNLSHPVVRLEELRALVRRVLTDFQEDVRNAVKDKGWDGTDHIDVVQWSFAGALLYAVTVITTIGYGHIAPKTPWGRMVTIIYALVGIPLTFLYLSNIGNFLADSFRLFYKKICCDVLCCKKCDRRRKRERLKLRRRREMAAQNNIILENMTSVRVDGTGKFTGGNPTENGRLEDTSNSNTTCDNLGFEDDDDDVRLAASSGEIKTPGGGGSGEGFKSEGDLVTTQPTPVLCTASKYRQRSRSLEDICDIMRETDIISEDDDDDDVNYDDDDDNFYSNIDVRETDIVDDCVSLAEVGYCRRKLKQANDDGNTLGIPGADFSQNDKEIGNLGANSVMQPSPTTPKRRRVGIGCKKIESNSFRDATSGPRRKRKSGQKQMSRSNPNLNQINAGTSANPSRGFLKPARTGSEKRRKSPKRTPSRNSSKGKKDVNFQEPLEEWEREISRIKEEKDAGGKAAGAGEGGSKWRWKKFSRAKSEGTGKTSDNITTADLLLTPSTSCAPDEITGNRIKNKTKRSATTSAERPVTKIKLKPNTQRPVSWNTQPFNKNNIDYCNNRRPIDKTRKKVVKTSSLPRSVSNPYRLRHTARNFEGLAALAASAAAAAATNRLPRRNGISIGAESPPRRRRHSMESIDVNLRRSESGKRRDRSGSRSRQRCLSDESFVTAESGDVHSADVSVNIDEEDTLPRVSNERSRLLRPAFGRSTTLPTDLGHPASTLNYMGGRYDVLSPLMFPGLNGIGLIDDPFDYELEEEQADGKVTVPIAVCLMLIAGYIAAGAAMFTTWEKWGYLDGSYFCFITLSTIGFGDIVPGTSMTDWESNEKLVLCALWLAFGLSLIAMCFNLMQEEVKDKFKWLGHKLGILNDEENTSER